VAAKGRKCNLCGAPLGPQVPNRQARCNSCRVASRVRNTSQSIHRFLSYKIVTARQRSGKIQVPFDLDIDEVYELYMKQQGNCALSGLPMTNIMDDERSVSFDRIDTSRGYHIDNVRLVASRVNLLRSDMSDVDFVWWCRAVANHNAD
jgi:hypothetical protein